MTKLFLTRINSRLEGLNVLEVKIKKRIAEKNREERIARGLMKASTRLLHAIGIPRREIANAN